MIALLSLGALSALGYFTSKNKLYENNVLYENPDDSPSNTDQYNSDYNLQKNKQLSQKRKIQYELSKDPLKTGVYNDVYRQNVNQVLLNNNINPEQQIISSLSGQAIKQKDFHQNMMPNIRKNIGNSNSNEYQQRQVELFTGQNSLSQQKQELTPLFRTTGYDPTDDMKDRFETARERAYVSKIQNNTLPFEQVRVQRGIGLGTDNVNYLGFQQPNINDIIKPKTVDDLRIATKNRVEYKKPVNAGVMPSQGQRLKLGQVMTQNKKNYQPRHSTFVPGGTIQKQPMEKTITHKYQQNNTYQQQQPKNMQSNKYLPTSQILPEPGIHSMIKQRKDPLYETFVEGTQRNIAAEQAYDISKQDYGKSGIRVDNTNRGQDVGFGLVSNAHNYNRAQPRNYQPPIENRKQFLELNPRIYNQVQTANSMQKYAFNQKEQQQNLQPTLKDTVQFGTLNQQQDSLGLNKNKQNLGFYTQRGIDSKESFTNREIDQFNNAFGIPDGYLKQTLRNSQVTKCPIDLPQNIHYGTPYTIQNQHLRQMQNNEMTKDKLNSQQQNTRFTQLEGTNENLLQQDGYRHRGEKQSVRPTNDNMFRQDLDTSDMVTQGLSFTQGPKQHNTYVNNTLSKQKYQDILHSNTQYPQKNNDSLQAQNTNTKQFYPNNLTDINLEHQSSSVQNQLKNNPYSIKK